MGVDMYKGWLPGHWQLCRQSVTWALVLVRTVDPYTTEVSRLRKGENTNTKGVFMCVD